MRKKFLILTGVFVAAVVGASFNLNSPRAYALTNAIVSGTNAQTGYQSTSFDGRYIAFLSGSSTLVSGDTNGKVDAFIRDTQANTTTRISISTTGTQANRDIQRVILTGNGRYALMATTATTLGGDTQYSQGTTNVYLRDIKLGTTTLVASGIGGSGVTNHAEALSEDGRFVYYSVFDTHLGTQGLKVKDMVTDTVTRIDVNDTGTGANELPDFSSASTSCDGRFVVFSSLATNLVANDTNGYGDVFLVDRMGGTIKDITASGNDVSLWPKISCDGNQILFTTKASNILASDTNSTYDIVQYSVPNDTYTAVSLDESGNQFGDNYSTSGGVSFGQDNVMSIDGRYVAFTDFKYFSGELRSRILLRDTWNATTTAITPAFNPYAASKAPALTADGKTLYYAYMNWVTTYDIYKASGY